MRYAYLKAYLDNVMPAIQVGTIIEAFELLHSAGIDGQDYEIQQELALAENGDTSTTIQSIYNLVTPLMILSLKQFGVELKEEATLAELVDVFRGIITLENYGDPMTIMQFCDNADGPEEAMSEILPFVGAYSVGHYLGLIENVHPRLLERIEAVSLTQLQEAPAHQNELEEIRERLIRFTRRVGETTFMVVHDIRNGSRLGMPLAAYLEPRLEELEELAKTSLISLTHQILAYVLASDTPKDKIRETCDNEFDALLEDKAKVTQADITLLALLAE